MSLPFHFGCLRQPEDVRDYRVPRRVRYSAVTADPAVIDLQFGCQYVDDQENIGSCAANAITGMIGFLFNLQKVPHAFKASRAALYWGGRKAIGTLTQDTGMTLRDGMSYVSTWGIVPETVWPYDGREAPHGVFLPGFNTEKSLGKDADGNIDALAKEWRLKTYHSLSENVSMDPAAESTMRAVLQSGYPFVFGIEVFASWFQNGTPSALIPMPNTGERGIGGHAMLCVGYCDPDKTWIVRNSWGTGVGALGYFRVHYAYMKRYGFDPWVGFELVHEQA